MTSSQADPAYSTTTETSNPGNPMTAPDGTSSSYNGADKPKQKLSFAERHKAPTTKDVETNKWVFGAQQGVSGPGDHSADGAGTDLGGLGPAGDGGAFTAGTAAGGNNDMGVGSGGRVTGTGAGMGGGQERYRDQMAGSSGEGAGYVGGHDTGYEGRMERPGGGGGGGSTTGVYEGTAGYSGAASGDASGDGVGMGSANGRGFGDTTGSGYDDATGTGTGAGGDDEYEDDGAGGRKKKMNPLKKVVQAMKNA